MSIANTIHLLDTIHLPGDHGGPNFVTIHLGTEFFHNCPEKDGDERMETALNERLRKRAPGALYRSYQSLHVDHLRTAYHVNVTILVSWDRPDRVGRNVTRAVVHQDQRNCSRTAMYWAIPVLREDIRRAFHVHMGDVLPPEWIDRLTEYYLIDILGKRTRRKKIRA